jgi:hypothetical protein
MTFLERMQRDAERRERDRDTWREARFLLWRLSLPKRQRRKMRYVFDAQDVRWWAR